MPHIPHWRRCRSMLVAILQEHLPDEWDLMDLSPIPADRITDDDTRLQVNDCLYVCYIRTIREARTKDWTDAGFEFEIEILRFGASRRAAEDVCGDTESAVCHVLGDHLGVYADDDYALDYWVKLEIGDSESLKAKAAAGAFAHALNLLVTVYARCPRTADHAPDA